MKKSKISIGCYLFVLSSLFLVVSCDSETPNENEVGIENEESIGDLEEVSNAISVETLIAIEESDAAIEDVSSILEEIYLEEESIFAAKIDNKSKRRYLSDCAEKTVVVTDGLKEVTIDFGEGCEMKNERVLKGKLIMTYAKNKELQTRTVTHSYDNFFVNDKQISGSSTSLKERSNSSGNRQTTFTEDILITWDSGETASRTGTKVSEIVVEGRKEGWASRVYEISGSWTSTSKAGVVHSVTITENLRKNLACRFIVSGKKSIVKGDKSGVLDFGEGACDDAATFTHSDGTIEEVTLQRKRKKDK